MRKFLTTVCAAVMAFGAVATTGPIASAAPVMPLVNAPLVNTGEGAGNLVQIQHRRWRRDGEWRRGGGDWRGGDFRRHRRGGDGWYNGHRGYRHYRRGYRQHGDWWFPAGAFIAGAIIGGALSDPSPGYYAPRRIYEPQYAPRRIYRSGGNAHVQWCYNRYRSYRAWDNSFQPYDGPRQLCYSPYR